MTMATAMRISGANTTRRTRLLTSGLWPRPGGRVAATRAVQRVAHAAYDTADDDRAASDPVEVAIQNEASSVGRDSRPINRERRKPRRCRAFRRARPRGRG